MDIKPHYDEYLNGVAFDQEAHSISVTERLIRRLRVAIFNGELRPGQKVVEADLCESYAVSRPIVREALRLLESERLIELIPNRGPFVAKLGATEVQDIHDVWAMLTGEAVRRFTERCAPADLKVLERTLGQLHKAIAAEDHVAQMSATNRFFYYVLDKSENGILKELTVNLVSRLMFLRAQSLLHHQWGHLYVREIEAVLKAMRERDADGARTAVMRHIASACAAAKQIPVVTPPAHRASTPAAQPAPRRARRGTRGGDAVGSSAKSSPKAPAKSSGG